MTAKETIFFANFALSFYLLLSGITQNNRWTRFKKADWRVGNGSGRNSMAGMASEKGGGANPPSSCLQKKVEFELGK